MDKLVIRELATLQIYKGSCASTVVDFDHGALAIDAIGHATAEDLLAALIPLTGEEKATAVVRILLDAQLTFDSTLDGGVR